MIRTRLRLMTYNALNAFDDVIDPVTNDDQTPPKCEQSCRAVAQIIDSSEADLVALQEIENLGMLERLTSYHGLDEKYPHRILIPGNDPRGADLALISRYPLQAVKSHRERILGWSRWQPRRFRRDLLQSDVQLPNGETLRVYIVHYPASKKAHWSRLREAEATREILLEQSASYPTDHQVVMGDFNAMRESDPLALLTSTGGLHNTSQNLAYSYGHRPGSRGRKLVDHILCSPSLVPHHRSSEILHHPLEELASDHLPVVADFEFTTGSSCSSNLS